MAEKVKEKKQKPIAISDESKIVSLASMLAENVRKADSSTQTLMDEIDINREYYSGKNNTAELWEGAPKINMPFIKASALALKAELYSTLLDTTQRVRVDPLKKAQTLHAQSYEKFRMRLDTKIEYVKKWKLAFDMAIRDRTSIVGLTWKIEETNTYDWEKKVDADVTYDYDEMGNPVEVETTIEETTPKRQVKVTYDLPFIEVIDVKNFRVLPSFDGDIQTSPGIAIKRNVLGRDIINMMNNGTFDKEASKSVLETVPNVDIENAEDVRDSISNEQLDYRTETSETDYDKYANETYNLVDIYFRYEKDCDWYITMDLESETILRAIPTPWWGYRRKFIPVRPYGNDKGIYGECIATLGGVDTQDAISKSISIAIGQGIRQVDPRMFVPKSTYEQLQKLKKENEFNKNGSLIPVPDGINPKDMANAEMTASPTSVLPIIQEVFGLAQGYFGINDASRGAQFAGNATATETLAFMEGSKRVLGLITANVASAMEEFEYCLFELIRQFYNHDMLNEIWEEATEDNDLSLEECIAYEYQFSAYGSFATSRMIQAKKADETLQMLLPIMQGLGLNKEMYDLILWSLQEKGMKNAEKLMGDRELWVALGDAMRSMQGLPVETQFDENGNPIQQQQPMGMPGGMPNMIEGGMGNGMQGQGQGYGQGNIGEVQTGQNNDYPQG